MIFPILVLPFAGYASQFSLQSLFNTILHEYFSSSPYTLPTLTPPNVSRICDASFNQITNELQNIKNSLNLWGCSISLDGAVACVQKYNQLICHNGGNYKQIPATVYETNKKISSLSNVIGGDIYKEQPVQNQSVVNLNYFNSYQGVYWKECALYGGDAEDCLEKRLSKLPHDIKSFKQNIKEENEKIPSTYINTAAKYKEDLKLEKELMQKCAMDKTCVENALKQKQTKEGKYKKRVAEESEGRKKEFIDKSALTDEICFTTEDAKEQIPTAYQKKYVEKSVKKNRTEELDLSYHRHHLKSLTILVDLSEYKENFTSTPFFKKDFEKAIKDMDGQIDTYIKN